MTRAALWWPVPTRAFRPGGCLTRAATRWPLRMLPSWRLVRLSSVLVADCLCLGNDSTGMFRLGWSASPPPFGPSLVAVHAFTVERGVIDPSVAARYLAGCEAFGTSQGSAAKLLSPPGNDLTSTHAHVTLDFTLSRLAATLPEVQQSLVRLVYLLEPLLRSRLLVAVGVILKGERAECSSDLLVGGVQVYAQNFAEVALVHSHDSDSSLGSLGESP